MLANSSSQLMKLLSLGVSCALLPQIILRLIYPWTWSVGPGAVKRMTALAEGYPERDQMTHLMSMLQLPPELAGSILSLLGLALCSAGLLLLITDKEELPLTVAAAAVFCCSPLQWLALLNGPDMIALGAVSLSLGLLKRSLWALPLSLWLCYWGVVLKSTSWPLLLLLVPVTIAHFPRAKIPLFIAPLLLIFSPQVSSLSLEPWLILSFLQNHPEWLLLISASFPIHKKNQRLIWLYTLGALIISILFLGDKLRPRYLTSLQVLFYLLSVDNLARIHKGLVVLIFGFSLHQGATFFQSWCHLFQEREGVSCPSWNPNIEHPAYLHSDHSALGAQELHLLAKTAPERGVLIPQLRDGREYHLRAIASLGSIPYRIITEKNCCHVREDRTQCATRLVENIRQYGGRLILPTPIEYQHTLRVPQKEKAWAMALQASLEAASNNEWWSWVEGQHSPLDLPCKASPSGR